MLQRDFSIAKRAGGAMYDAAAPEIKAVKSLTGLLQGKGFYLPAPTLENRLKRRAGAI